MSLKQKRVVIENALGAKRFITAKKADRMLERGIARSTGVGRIRLLESEWLHEAKQMSSRRITEIGYDRIDRPMTIDDVTHIPVIRARKLFHTSGTNRRQTKVGV